ncbi:MAG: hypothetical protein JRJ69_14045 [Deltaproteobacteria bacterium]|nr:hypothetical protein [Deltaproteobacteria bacterium]
MQGEKPTTAERVGSVESNIYVKMRKWHNVSFMIVILALCSWVIARIAAVYLPGETQPLVTQYFYLAGWCIWSVIGVYLFSTLLSAIAAIKSSTDKVHTAVVWTLYLIFLFSVAYFFTAFRISAIGIHGLLSGLTNSIDNAAYMMVKFYPYFPLTAVNLMSSGMGNSSSRYIEMIASLSSVSLPYIILLGIAFLSLFLRKKNRFFVVVLFLFAVAGLGLTYLIETGFRDVSLSINRDLLRAAPVLNYFFSCLSTLMAGILFYGTVRLMSFKRTTDDKHDKLFRPLPPGAICLLIILILLAPSLGDLENVHSLERNGRAIIEAKR